ncbi:MAG: glycosyltransferase family 2 protein [Methanobacteriota archaeon]|nr:MAG: glycosyltransferase family 2 protein [Euryarchaeota archaeon]TLZ65286.1 MAG: glycosyltransferase family 2 protein [Euryarchaeota archaeon]
MGLTASKALSAPASAKLVPVVPGLLSIVIPAHNEESRIAETVLSYAAALQGAPYELVLAIDGCEDRTGEVARSLQARVPSIKIVQSPTRLGKGGGVLEGIRQASGSWIAFMDADGALSPPEFLALLTKVQANGCAGVIGSRYWDRQRIQGSYGFLRWLLSRAFNKSVRFLFGLPFEDTQCGAKIFRRDAIEAVMSEIRLRGYAFDVELLWRLEKAGYEIRELPISWDHKNGSSIKLSREAPRMLSDIIRMRLNG